MDLEVERGVLAIVSSELGLRQPPIFDIYFLRILKIVIGSKECLDFWAAGRGRGKEVQFEQ